MLDCDLLVIGAGMAGLSAAALASEAGARVVVVEKGPAIGGTAIASGGVFWSVPTLKKLQAHDDGDPDLGRVVVEGYAAAVAWIRRRQVLMSKPIPVFYGRGYTIDIAGHLNACAATVEASGGHVVVDTRVERLTLGAAGQVTGALTSHADGEVEIRAPWTLLATGGCQGSPALRAALVHPQARDIILRANPHSTGDGRRLALAAGAAPGRENPGFYGHLIAHPVAVTLPTFVLYSQIHSEYGLLLNEQGERFADESLGDHVNTQATVPQPGARALLVWDEQVQQENVLKPYIAGRAPIDKLAVALQAGAHGCKVADLDGIAAFAERHGFPGRRVADAVEQYNLAAAEAPETLQPPRVGNLRPLDRPPYYGLVVVPAITFTHAGIRVDVQARALRPSGTPVDGLLVAGVDAGDVYRGGYAGGLAMAATFAMRAVATAGWT